MITTTPTLLLPSTPPNFFSIPTTTTLLIPNRTLHHRNRPNIIRPITAAASSSTRPIRYPLLDRHATKANRLRFVRKLTTLLLSKPRHFLPLKILSRCRHYLHPTCSLIRMVFRYPAFFTLFYSPTSTTPLLCVGLTPAAVSMAAEEAELKARVAEALAVKLHKLLMMTTHKRLLLDKIVHLAPDLGMPVDFRSRLCRRFPERFRVLDSERGRVLELVGWDQEAAMPVRMKEGLLEEDRLIMDRPLKFKKLRLRKGLNLKRQHRDYLLRFQELPEVSPYLPFEEALEAGLAEKRACVLVRELLAMTVERRTLVDHLTHFRKEMGLPNKLRGLLVRHPEMFYISLKGMRDSVFLAEGYDGKGRLIEKNELLATKERLVELVRESKRMRRERRKDTSYGDGEGDDETEEDGDDADDDEEEEDDLDCMFETGIGDDWEEFSGIDAADATFIIKDEGAVKESLEFWSTKGGANGGRLEELQVW